MTTERIRQITAEKVMGWEWNSDGGFDPIEWYQKTGGYKPIIAVSDWKPDLDRNQSRMVVEKAREILGTDDKLVSAFWDGMDAERLVWAWIEATPLQECEACLRALGLWEEA